MPVCEKCGMLLTWRVDYGLNVIWYCSQCGYLPSETYNTNQTKIGNHISNKEKTGE